MILLNWISRGAKAELASLLDQAAPVSSNALTRADLVFTCGAASLGGSSKNHYGPSRPVPMKSVTIFETPVGRKTSALGTCTHVPWCGDPMICNGRLLLELTDASLRLIASASVMMLI